MAQIFLTIAGVVIVLNIVYLLLPDGEFAKYSQLIAGLVVICVVLGVIFNTQITSDILHFDETVPMFNSESLEEVINGQTIKVVQGNIKKYLSGTYGENVIKDVKIEVADNVISSVVVKISDLTLREKIINDVAKYCDIKIDNIVVE